jgi:predicted double-glycine peptidase
MKYKVLLLVLFCILVLCVSRLFFDYSHPLSYQIKNFNTVTQPDSISCGPASVLMVLRAYDKDFSLDIVTKHTHTEWFSYDDQRFGMTDPAYIAVALKKLSVPAKKTTGNLIMLKHFVSQNKPVVVLVRSGKYTWHYVVVIGYDPLTIVIADPADGLINTIPAEDFLSSWAFASNMEGYAITGPCFICKGSGLWTQYNLGPLSYCEACNGIGSQPDYVGGLIKTADIYPFTMIVPQDPIKK